MSETLYHSLLSDPLVSIRSPDGTPRQVTLPGVLAGLTRDEIVAFEALQVHQRQAWFCFLVQLAAIALPRAGRQDLPEEPEQWRELLLALTDGDEAPWCLVVEDVSRPAFMQPPVPEGSLEEAGYRADITTPDQLDLLVTSKNHDVKGQRVSRPGPHHWLFALVDLQNLEGYFGRGNYGIVRMNRGYGNRPFVGLTSSLDWGPRFRRDAAVLLSARKALIQEYDYAPRGHALLWLLPWDGQKDSGLQLQDCDPLFIEVCRRIRFTESGGQLCAWRANTSGARIAAPDDLAGVTGDPWTPVDKADGKALTVAGSGFRYDLLQRILLSGDYARPAAMRGGLPEDQGGYLMATTIVRGEGKTEGLHHRVVPVPANALGCLSEPSEREKLAERAQERVADAATTQTHILFPALRALLAAGGQANVDSQKLRPWTNAFDAAVDDVFFPELWASLDLPPREGRRRWQQTLRALARDQLQDAIQSAPLPSIGRWRAISAAEAVFHAGARRHLTALYPRTEEEDHVALSSR